MDKCDPTRGVGFPGPFPSRQGVSPPSRQGVSAERERPLPAALADLLLGILNHGYAIPVLSYNPYELWGPRPFPASRKPTPLVKINLSTKQASRFVHTPWLLGVLPLRSSLQTLRQWLLSN